MATIPEYTRFVMRWGFPSNRQANQKANVMTLTLSDSQLLTLYNALSSFSMELDDNKEHWKDLADAWAAHQKNISDILGMMRDDLRRIAAPPPAPESTDDSCTCKPDCPKTCTGRSCGCAACFNAYCDAMEYD